MKTKGSRKKIFKYSFYYSESELKLTSVSWFYLLINSVTQIWFYLMNKSFCNQFLSSNTICAFKIEIVGILFPQSEKMADDFALLFHFYTEELNSFWWNQIFKRHSASYEDWTREEGISFPGSELIENGNLKRMAIQGT